MKRAGNIYRRIHDFKSILDTYRKQISINTKNKNKVYRYEYHLLSRLSLLQEELQNGNVSFSSYHIFLIHEPKARIIMSQEIKDKLINHLVAKYFLLKTFEPVFIDSNVATRIGKGTNHGIMLTKRYLNELKKDNSKIYYLKCDISKYFYQIDHEILLETIKKKIKDQKALSFIQKIIDSGNSFEITKRIQELKENEIDRIKKLDISEHEKEVKILEISRIPEFNEGNKGIPIGNMTSQAFALIYLNEFDHYVKEVLKIKGYVRYKM